MAKPKVAIFDFACCEGCQLQVVNMEEALLDLLNVVDVVEWREAMSEQSEIFDIAIIEGSITRPQDEEKLLRIRKKANEANHEMVLMKKMMQRISSTSRRCLRGSNWARSTVSRVLGPAKEEGNVRWNHKTGIPSRIVGS